MINPIVIDCGKGIDVYTLRVSPLHKYRVSKGAPSSVTVEVEPNSKNLSGILWKALVRILLNRKRIPPCVVRNPSNYRKVYFKYGKKLS